MPKFFKEIIKTLKLLEERAYPIPLIGPIRGDINIAPIMTAGELFIKPIDATTIEQIKIQTLIPENTMSFFMSSMVCLLSTSS